MKKKKQGREQVGNQRLKIKLIETMDAIVPDTVWKMLYAKVLDSDVNAIKNMVIYTVCQSR
jgi:hypothetical protein